MRKRKAIGFYRDKKKRVRPITTRGYYRKNMKVASVLHKPIPEELEPLGREARSCKTYREFEDKVATRQLGNHSRTPLDVAQVREDMGTLPSYDRETQRDWFGRYTQYETLVPTPTQRIRVYRASSTEDYIKPGNYVTQSRKYAEEHLETVLHGKGKILTITCTIDDLAPVNPNEFWFVPKSMTKYKNLEEFWQTVRL